MARREPRRLSRRQFAFLGTQAVGAVVTLLLGIPIVGTDSFCVTSLASSRGTPSRTIANTSVPLGRSVSRLKVPPPEASRTNTKRPRAT